MSQEIIVEGSTQEIAQKIAEFPGKVLKAILVVEENTASLEEDAWTRDLRRWAASHKSAKSQVDYSRESIYEERLR
ncbi:MAG TPA: hypothetical protein VGN88_09150 [Phycisphaerae bacterium]|jgi:hypothetical protein